MANKTNPIGVRFRTDVLEKLKVDHGVDSPQQGLVFLEQFYVQHHKLAKDITQVLRDEPKADLKLNAAPKAKKLPHVPKKEEKADNGAGDAPKTLEDVKALCPKNLIGVDRSIWIAENRKAYDV